LIIGDLLQGIDDAWWRDEHNVGEYADALQNGSENESA
jgi:hypothetical protein